MPAAAAIYTDPRRIVNPVRYSHIPSWYPKPEPAAPAAPARTTAAAIHASSLDVLLKRSFFRIVEVLDEYPDGIIHGPL
jgi:hypothetical protein